MVLPNTLIPQRVNPDADRPRPRRRRRRDEAACDFRRLTFQFGEAEAGDAALSQ